MSEQKAWTGTPECGDTEHFYNAETGYIECNTCSRAPQPESQPQQPVCAICKDPIFWAGTIGIYAHTFGSQSHDHNAVLDEGQQQQDALGTLMVEVGQHASNIGELAYLRSALTQARAKLEEATNTYSHLIIGYRMHEAIAIIDAALAATQPAKKG